MIAGRECRVGRDTGGGTIYAAGVRGVCGAIGTFLASSDLSGVPVYPRAGRGVYHGWFFYYLMFRALFGGLKC